MDFYDAVRAGIKGMTEGPDPVRFEFAGKSVRCSHCAGDKFIKGRAQLNTAGLTFFGLDWANRSAATLLCARCGHIEWFVEDPETTE